jgi:methionyl aminopeptidase
MINVGVSGEDLWPDQWTVVTRDGKRSAQFEHTIIITDDGCELLTARVGASRREMVWDEAFVNRPLPPGAAAGGAAAAAAASAASAGDLD